MTDSNSTTNVLKGDYKTLTDRKNELIKIDQGLSAALDGIINAGTGIFGIIKAALIIVCVSVYYGIRAKIKKDLEDIADLEYQNSQNQQNHDPAVHDPNVG
jgi:hypothetical protein